VEPDDLDESPDLGLRAAQEEHALADAQAAREHRQVEHQRGVGVHQAGEIDDDIAIGADGAREGAPPDSLCRPVLVPNADESRSVFVVRDDRGNLPNVTVMWQPDSQRFLDFSRWRLLKK
jgi:hypothetical protein